MISMLHLTIASTFAWETTSNICTQRGSPKVMAPMFWLHYNILSQRLQASSNTVGSYWGYGNDSNLLTEQLLSLQLWFWVWLDWQHRSNCMTCALYILVGFDRFLRTGELLNLRVFNIQFGTSKAVITLHETKTGKRKGNTEMVSVTSPLVLRWLRKACAGKKPEDLLLNQTYYQLRMLFRQFLCHFDINNLQYNLYSLRRGGCTSFFFEYGSLDLTVEVGRWSDSATARIYIQNAAAESAEISLSARQCHMLQESAKALKNCI